MALGKTIKKLREKQGLSQDDLSRLTNGVVSQGTISALEKRDSSSSEFVIPLAKALKVTVQELLTGNINTIDINDVIEILKNKPELISLIQIAEPLSPYGLDVLKTTGAALAKPAPDKNGTQQ